jgi:hypothetical protein
VPTALRRLAADFEPRTLATMHGPAFEGDAGTALRDLADAWEVRFGGAADPTRRSEEPTHKETGP